jgi:coproporphyrinogen III oxidase
MTASLPSSSSAQRTLALLQALQARFTAVLQDVARARGSDVPFATTTWLRDGGRHGGGARTGVGRTPVFAGASVNVSAVHYDDEPARPLSAAVALSTIVHPAHPRAPSVHLHFSRTEQKSGAASWRLMADLNPSIPIVDDTARFVAAVRDAAGDVYERAARQGDKYFFIPALQRHRGATHFYLENWQGASFDDERAYVERVATTAIDAYGALLGDRLAALGEAPVDDDDRRAQLAYHTLYLFQVLTLDRGTTSGLLVHADNDLGSMGSLPPFVDRALLSSWEPRVPDVQRPLVRGIVDVLPAPTPGSSLSAVTDDVRRALAQTVRAHYRAYPAALDLQAAGDVVPPTVANHLGR